MGKIFFFDAEDQNYANISFRYTRWVNKRQKRIDHLFQGRFKAILVDSDDYLLERVRYIHLIPVRAGLVKKVEKYPWISHPAYLGMEILSWLTTGWLYAQYSRQRAVCIREYSKFVADGVGELYREEFHSGSSDGRILGDDDFIEKVLVMMDVKSVKLPSLKKIIKVVCSV